MTAICCPRCGASEANGDEFELLWTTRVTYAAKVTSSDDGVLMYPTDTWSEVGFERTRRATLSCNECGHTWITSRKMEV